MGHNHTHTYVVGCTPRTPWEKPPIRRIWVITYFTHIFVTLYLNIITKNNNKLHILNIGQLHRTVLYTGCFPVSCAVVPHMHLKLIPLQQRYIAYLKYSCKLRQRKKLKDSINGYIAI